MKKQLLLLATCLLTNLSLFAQNSLTINVSGIEDEALSQLVNNERIGREKDGQTTVQVKARLVTTDKKSAMQTLDQETFDITKDGWNKGWTVAITFKAELLADFPSNYDLTVFLPTSNENDFRTTIKKDDIKDGMTVSLKEYVYENKQGVHEPMNKIWVKTPSTILDHYKTNRPIDSVFVAEIKSDGSYSLVCSGKYKAKKGDKFFFTPAKNLTTSRFTEARDYITYSKTWNGNYAWTISKELTLKDFFSDKVMLNNFTGELGKAGTATVDIKPAGNKPPKLKPLKFTSSLPCDGSGVMVEINKAKICVSNPVSAGGMKKSGQVHKDFVTKAGSTLYPIKAGKIVYNSSNLSLVEGVLFQENRVKVSGGYVVLRKDSRVEFDASMLTAAHLKKDVVLNVGNLKFPVMASGDNNYDIRFHKITGSPLYFKLSEETDLFNDGVFLPRGTEIFLKGGKVKSINLPEETTITFDSKSIQVAKGSEANPSFELEKNRIIKINASSSITFTIDGMEIKSMAGGIEWNYDKSGARSLSKFKVAESYSVKVYKGSKSKTKDVSKGQSIVIEGNKVVKIQ